MALASATSTSDDIAEVVARRFGAFLEDLRKRGGVDDATIEHLVDSGMIADAIAAAIANTNTSDASVPVKGDPDWKGKENENEMLSFYAKVKITDPAVRKVLAGTKATHRMHFQQLCRRLAHKGSAALGPSWVVRGYIPRDAPVEALKKHWSHWANFAMNHPDGMDAFLLRIELPELNDAHAFAVAERKKNLEMPEMPTVDAGDKSQLARVLVGHMLEVLHAAGALPGPAP